MMTGDDWCWLDVICAGSMWFGKYIQPYPIESWQLNGSLKKARLAWPCRY